MNIYRIFLVIGGKASPNDNSNMWVRNLYDPLLAAGHDVFLLDIDQYATEHKLGYMSKKAKERLSNDLPEIFRREHNKKPFDIYFSYLHNGQIIPDVLKEINKKVYTVNYSTNYHQFEMYKDVASIVDCNIYVSKIAKEGFDELGVKSYWMPLAANPDFYQPSSKKNNHTVFIGSVYGPRALLFWRLLQYGIDLKLYGYGWLEQKNGIGGLKSKIIRSVNNFLNKAVGCELKKIFNDSGLEYRLRMEYNSLNDSILALMRKDYLKNLHDSLGDYDYVKTLSEAGIVVNIQESRYNHDFSDHRVLFGSNLRDYETTMCRSFLCTQYSDEITELFEVGKEIICYYNEHDLADKIKYYTKNLSAKEEIAKAGYRKSISQHTWKRRFEDFFKGLSI